MSILLSTSTIEGDKSNKTNQNQFLLFSNASSFNSLTMTQKPYSSQEFFDRQFTVLEPIDSKINENVIILKHYAELLIISISPNHQIRKNPKEYTIKKVVFDEKILPLGKLTGKRKKNAKQVEIGSLICTIHCEHHPTLQNSNSFQQSTGIATSSINANTNTIHSFEIKSPLFGTVVEVNTNLSKDSSALLGYSKTIGDDWFIVLGKNWMNGKDNQSVLVSKIKPEKQPKAKLSTQQNQHEDEDEDEDEEEDLDED
jgi:hypothetical protein